jgi:hypothetical protein
MIHRQTSKDAYEAADTKKLTDQVLRFVISNCGATCDEAQLQLGMTHQSCSPCFTALSKEGRIADSGTRRRTRSGRNATVWMESQPDLLWSTKERGLTDLRRDVILAAVHAMDTGDFRKFAKELRELSKRSPKL